MGVALKIEDMNVSMKGRGLSALNDWRSPAYVTREKSVIFTRGSTYMIFELHFTNTYADELFTIESVICI